MPMAAQVRRTVAWVYGHDQRFGGDPQRIYVSGQSSGGHLAGVLLITDWRKAFDLPADRPKSRVAATRGSGDKKWRHSWWCALISVPMCSPLLRRRS